MVTMFHVSKKEHDDLGLDDVLFAWGDVKGCKTSPVHDRG